MVIQGQRILLAGGLGHVGNNVSAILLGLETREVHLGLGDELLGVKKVVKEGLLSPGDTYY
jgi:hypothetical protein